MSEHDGKTDCTPNHCSYGKGHACASVTRYPERFAAGGSWTYAWRKPRGYWS